MDESVGQLNWQGLAGKIGWNGTEDTLHEILAGWQYIGPSDTGLDLFRLRAGLMKPEDRRNRYIEVERIYRITPDVDVTEEIEPDIFLNES